MSKIPGTETSLELLVNCKTYPAVSTKYVETVCTGGVQPSGEFVRLYPIQFRFLAKDEQYDRWDVIRVKAYRDSKDTRPESWHLAAGSEIQKLQHIGSEAERWDWMKHTVHESTDDMERKGLTNGCVEIEPIELYYEPDKVEWTEKQKELIAQKNFFLEETAMRAVEERVPYQFRLRFRQKIGSKEQDGKVLAWSYYAGYQRNRRDGLSENESLERVANRVRGSIFNPEKTVFAIFGTHSRFKTWMISSLYHLPTKIIRKDSRSLF
jgi:hypothetical protein